MLYRFLLAAALCLVLAPAQGEASIIIHEFLADPASGLAGDANGDGTRSTSDDEFVEIFNTTDLPVDLTGWLLGDATKTRHIFPVGTSITAQSALVVFGGGSPNLDGIDWQVSSTGSLSLNNSGDTISLKSVTDELIDQIVYGSEANHNQSLSLSPEGAAGVFAPHTDLPSADGLLFSPGYLVTAPVIAEGPGPQTSAVPEPMSMMTLALGLILTAGLRGRRP